METHTPRPRKAQIEDQNILWTERVARARPTAPVRRLSASQEPRLYARSEAAARSRVENSWEDQSHVTGSRDSDGTAFFGFPTTITQRAENLDDLEPELNRSDEEYERRAIAAFEDGDEDDQVGHDILVSSPGPKEAYRTYLDMISGNVDKQEAHEDPQDNDSHPPISERVTNAFAIHVLTQAGRGGLQNETPNLFQTKRLRLTQRPRFQIYGHQASLWLTNYDYGSFLALAEALTLHEQQIFGYQPHFNQKQSIPFVAEIRVMGEWTRKVRFGGSLVADKRAYLQNIRPIVDEGDSEPVIWVHTDALECNFECDCYEPGELIFEAPDHGSLRVSADWGQWQQRAVSNSLVFDNSFLALIFLPQTFNDRNHYQLDLPNGQTFRVSWSGVDATRGPTLTNDVQEALSRVSAGVTKENIVQKKIKIQLVRGSFEGLQLDRPEGISNPQSPTQARARGTVFVYRPARTTSFKYDAPHTMERFLALSREHLYPDTPGNKLRIMISPNIAARDKGLLLTPISEVAGGHSKEDEYFWSKCYVADHFNPYQDVWAIKMFDFIKVYDGTITRDERKRVEWDTRGLSQGKSIYNKATKNIELIGPRMEIMDILAEISKTLLGIDPRESSQGIILHVRHPGQAGGDKEWLKWSARHTFNDFLIQVLYKIDGDEVAIYPPEHTEPNMPTAAKTTGVVEKQATTQQPTEKQPADNQTFRAKMDAERDRLRAAHQSPPGIKPGFNKPYHVGGAGYIPPLAPGLREFGPSRYDPDMLPEDSCERQFTDTTIPQTASNTAIGLESIRGLRAESEALQREESCKVCGRIFISSPESSNRIRAHYKTHATPPPRPCPHEGCLENLEDRTRYPTFKRVLDHLSSHDNVFRCTRQYCHCPLDLLSLQQHDEHLRLHPMESSIRPSLGETEGTPAQVPSRQPRRDSATQTTDSWREPERAEHDKNTETSPLHDIDDASKGRCDKCFRVIEHLSFEEKKKHATNCRTDVEEGFFVDTPFRVDSRTDRQKAAYANKANKERTRGKRKGRFQTLAAESDSAIPSQAGESEPARTTRSGKTGRGGPVQPSPSQKQASITQRPEVTAFNGSEPKSAPPALKTATDARVRIERGQTPNKGQDGTHHQATDSTSNNSPARPGDDNMRTFEHPNASLSKDTLLMPPPETPSKATETGATASSKTNKRSADSLTEDTEQPSTKKLRVGSSNSQPSEGAPPGQATSSASSSIQELAGTSSAHVASIDTPSVTTTLSPQAPPADPIGSKRKRIDGEDQPGAQSAQVPRGAVKKPRTCKPKAGSKIPADATHTSPDSQQPVRQPSPKQAGAKGKKRKAGEDKEVQESDQKAGGKKRKVDEGEEKAEPEDQRPEPPREIKQPRRRPLKERGDAHIDSTANTTAPQSLASAGTARKEPARRPSKIAKFKLNGLNAPIVRFDNTADISPASGNANIDDVPETETGPTPKAAKKAPPIKKTIAATTKSKAEGRTKKQDTDDSATIPPTGEPPAEPKKPARKPKSVDPPAEGQPTAAPSTTRDSTKELTKLQKKRAATAAAKAKAREDAEVEVPASAPQSEERAVSAGTGTGTGEDVEEETGRGKRTRKATRKAEEREKDGR